ncbi:hypothetical protein SOVF_215230, partial [Spinacia oleracea]
SARSNRNDHHYLRMVTRAMVSPTCIKAETFCHFGAKRTRYILMMFNKLGICSIRGKLKSLDDNTSRKGLAEIYDVISLSGMHCLSLRQ